MLGLYALLALLSSPTAAEADAKAASAVRAELVTPDEGGSSNSRGAAESGPRYTADLTDAEIEVLAQESPEELGSLSFGPNLEGRLLFGVQFPAGPSWQVVDPPNSFGTAETVAAIIAVVQDVEARLPGPPMRINHLSRKNGGRLRSHRSHQAGRDVDLGFYRLKAGPKAGEIDLARNWALVRALVTSADVEFILVGRRIQRQLYDLARSLGEDKNWLDSLFSGKDGLLQHAPNHNDHFHVRLFNPRAQELGRRSLPFLRGIRKDLASAVHRVQPGDTLASIARQHGSSAAAIRRANGLSSEVLPESASLIVPRTGSCIECLAPPPASAPPRRLPPSNPPLFDSGTPHPTLPAEVASGSVRS
jgi:murein endopeptidase